MKLASILIGSENPDTLVAYYTKLLGEPMYSDGGYTSWDVGGSGVTVGPHSEVHGKNTAPGRLLWNLETDDVPGDAARFKANGAIVVKDAYDF